MKRVLSVSSHVVYGYVGVSYFDHGSLAHVIVWTL